MEEEERRDFKWVNSDKADDSRRESDIGTEGGDGTGGDTGGREGVVRRGEGGLYDRCVRCVLGV